MAGEHHPNDSGHQIMADLAVNFIVSAVLRGLNSPELQATVPSQPASHLLDAAHIESWMKDDRCSSMVGWPMQQVFLSLCRPLVTSCTVLVCCLLQPLFGDVNFSATFECQSPAGSERANLIPAELIPLLQCDASNVDARGVSSRCG